MNNLGIDDILKVCNGTMLTKISNVEIADFSKDTRTIKKGEFYVAIKGESINGNDFVEEALEKGAIGCLIDEEVSNKILDRFYDRAIIQVENTIDAIQKIARYKRNMYNIPVVAVTGSVRKN